MAVELTKDKTKAFINVFQDEFTRKPKLLGIFPNSTLEDQLTADFDIWLSSNKLQIKNSVMNENILVQQLSILRTDHPEWMSFLHRWKLRRIIQDDDFIKVWSWVAAELNIEGNDKGEAE